MKKRLAPALLTALLATGCATSPDFTNVDARLPLELSSPAVSAASGSINIYYSNARNGLVAISDPPSGWYAQPLNPALRPWLTPCPGDVHDWRLSNAVLIYPDGRQADLLGADGEELLLSSLGDRLAEHLWTHRLEQGIALDGAHIELQGEPLIRAHYTRSAIINSLAADFGHGLNARVVGLTVDAQPVRRDGESVYPVQLELEIGNQGLSSRTLRGRFVFEDDDEQLPREDRYIEIPPTEIRAAVLSMPVSAAEGADLAGAGLAPRLEVVPARLLTRMEADGRIQEAIADFHVTAPLTAYDAQHRARDAQVQARFSVSDRYELAPACRHASAAEEL